MCAIHAAAVRPQVFNVDPLSVQQLFEVAGQEERPLVNSTIDPAIWDAGDCAQHFKVCRKHFLRDLRYRDGFPKQLDWSLEGRPRWSAQAVKDWAVRQHYANAA